ncbi:uncharacterized protein PG998_009029 [Apiospora kogelbergensis]|uniref:uncharacterized protein n=1 Tax=Apiospora kogelbergensis TaxID=1337665 RepID=UPI00312FF1D8
MQREGSRNWRMEVVACLDKPDFSVHQVLLVVLRKGFGLDENGPADELVVHLYDLYLDGKVNVPGVGAVSLLADVKSSHVVKKEVDQAQVSNSSHESEPIKANEALQAVVAKVHKVCQFAILKNAANATGRELAEAISAGFHVGAMDSACPVEGGGAAGPGAEPEPVGQGPGLARRRRLPARWQGWERNRSEAS